MYVRTPDPPVADALNVISDPACPLSGSTEKVTVGREETSINCEEFAWFPDPSATVHVACFVPGEPYAWDAVSPTANARSPKSHE